MVGTSRRRCTDDRFENPGYHRRQEASQTWLDNRPGGYTQFEDLRDRLTAAGATYKLTDSDRNNCVDSRLPTNCVYADKGASAGTKIFYNANTVKMLRSGSKLLPGATGAEGSRYVAWAEAVQLSTGKHLLFADAHLEIGKDAASNDVRKRQAQTVVDTIKSNNPSSLPVVLVGDMNSNKWSDPSNGAYDVITSQGLIDPLGNTYKSWYPSGAATAEKVVNRRVNSWNGFERAVRQGADGTSGAYIDYIFTSKMRVSYYENVAKIDALGTMGDVPVGSQYAVCNRRLALARGGLGYWYKIAQTLDWGLLSGVCVGIAVRGL